ncbi:MAG: LOG family protein [Planctomycetota bacterium]
MAKKTVSVFGTSKALPGDGNWGLALRLGDIIARAGFNIANGGYGGTMEAAAKAAVRAGAEVIGVTCSAFKRGSANPYVTREIKTCSLSERLAKLVELGDAYIVLPGGTGTLLELAQVWELKNKGFIPQSRPIIIVGSFWQPIIGLVCAEDPQAVGCVDCVDLPGQAVQILERCI